MLTLEGGTTIRDNQALGGVGTAYVNGYGGAGGNVFGGGLYVAGGTATLTNATVSSNRAQGGAGYFGAYAGGKGGNGGGGGLYVAGGTVTLTNVTLSSNTAQGGQGGGSSEAGGNGGNGLGGAGGERRHGQLNQRHRNKQ